jgi:hypothetical protein
LIDQISIYQEDEGKINFFISAIQSQNMHSIRYFLDYYGITLISNEHDEKVLLETVLEQNSKEILILIWE